MGCPRYNIRFCLMLYLVFPLFGGILAISTGNQSTERPFVLVPEALVGIIILATALGGLTLWFAENRDKKEGITVDKRMVKLAGKFFLYAALLFSISLMLLPIIPSIRDKTDFYNTSLRYIGGFCLMGGQCRLCLQI